MTADVNQRLVSYSTSGKMISVEKTFSEDGLTFTHKSCWIDQAAFDEYDNDPELQEFWQQRNSYCAAVGINIGPKDLAISS
jgi:quinol monooxygenase YgiN